MAAFTAALHTPPESPFPEQKTRQVWTLKEDRLLTEAVAKETPAHGQISWHRVAAHLPGRSNKDCRKRWHYSVANTIRKGTWLREEDERLREAVGRYGARWSKIAEAVGTRNGDQCWKRWYDCLDPRIDKSPWTAEEDAKLLHLVALQGRNWSEIVHAHFPNRTSLAAKNRFSILRRKHDGAGARAARHPRPAGNNNTTANTSSNDSASPSLLSPFAAPTPNPCPAAAASTSSTAALLSPYLGLPSARRAASPSTTASPSGCWSSSLRPSLSPGLSRSATPSPSPRPGPSAHPSPSPSPYCLATAPATPSSTTISTTAAMAAYATPEPEPEMAGWLGEGVADWGDSLAALTDAEIDRLLFPGQIQSQSQSQSQSENQNQSQSTAPRHGVRSPVSSSSSSSSSSTTTFSGLRYVPEQWMPGESAATLVMPAASFGVEAQGYVYDHDVNALGVLFTGDGYYAAQGASSPSLGSYFHAGSGFVGHGDDGGWSGTFGAGAW